eukprot:8719080-Pyramimonas_sp.AAC.1
MPEAIEFSTTAPVNTKRDPAREGPSTIQMRKIENIISRLMELAVQISKYIPGDGQIISPSTIMQRLNAQRLWDKVRPQVRRALRISQDQLSVGLPHLSSITTWQQQLEQRHAQIVKERKQARGDEWRRRLRRSLRFENGRDLYSWIKQRQYHTLHGVRGCQDKRVVTQRTQILEEVDKFWHTTFNKR